MKNNKIEQILRHVAKQYNTTPEEVRYEMEQTIDACWNDPDPAIHAKWEAMSAIGEKPTVEEFLTYMVQETLRRQAEADPVLQPNPASPYLQ